MPKLKMWLRIKVLVRTNSITLKGSLFRIWQIICINTISFSKLRYILSLNSKIINNLGTDKFYTTTLSHIKEKIISAQHATLKAVNSELINLYKDIDKLISEAKTKGAWGDSTVESLAKNLQVENPGVKGFSKFNIINIFNLT